MLLVAAARRKLRRARLPRSEPVGLKLAGWVVQGVGSPLARLTQKNWLAWVVGRRSAGALRVPAGPV